MTQPEWMQLKSIALHDGIDMPQARGPAWEDPGA